MRNLTKPEPYEGLVMTPRDEAIVLAAHRYRLLSTDQVRLLVGWGSVSKSNERLRQLWSVDMLDRPEIQREMFSHAKKRPTLHALGKAGAEWLTKHHGIRFPKSVDWRAKNKAIKGSDFVRHTLGVTDTMLQAERDFEPFDGLRLVDKEEVWTCAPSFNPRKKKPFVLPTQYVWKDGTRVKRGTEPDYPFAIVDSRGESPTKGLLFLEYDNNTESYVRRSGYQSSILQKQLGYADAYNRKLCLKLYGYNRFRVLFVVAGNPERVDQMIAVYQAHVAKLIPGGAFLFTTKERLETKGFLAPIWLSGKGNTVSLIAPPGRPPSKPPARRKVPQAVA